MTVSLASLGWDAEFAAAYRPYDRRDNRPGRVSRVDLGVCTVVTAQGITRASLAGRMLGIVAKDPLAMPTVGDWVVVRRWGDDRHTLEAVLTRRSAVVLAAAGKTAEGQVIASNADVFAVVESLDPAPVHGRIERLMALACDSGAQPLLLLTKADTVEDVDLVAADLSSAAPPGAPVLAVSTVTGEGMDRLRRYVAPGKTLGLLGAPEAGKSTVVNALVGAVLMTTRRLRADRNLRQTTSSPAMVPVPGGGAVLDTPGLRTDGADAFGDLERLAAACRINDCTHDTEPGCEVRAGVERGDVTVRRLDNRCKPPREQVGERSRSTARQESPTQHRDAG